APEQRTARRQNQATTATEATANRPDLIPLSFSRNTTPLTIVTPAPTASP
ncbi:hypothetical protein JKG47_12585, partial [Acidithiobacillus sp. MC6.1]|nr:hypothetical protein [Acidithiobacillus sp. MC6.1]